MHPSYLFKFPFYVFALTFYVHETVQTVKVHRWARFLRLENNARKLLEIRLTGSIFLRHLIPCGMLHRGIIHLLNPSTKLTELELFEVDRSGFHHSKTPHMCNTTANHGKMGMSVSNYDISINVGLGLHREVVALRSWTKELVQRYGKPDSIVGIWVCTKCDLVLWYRQQKKIEVQTWTSAGRVLSIEVRRAGLRVVASLNKC